MCGFSGNSAVSGVECAVLAGIPAVSCFLSRILRGILPFLAVLCCFLLFLRDSCIGMVFCWGSAYDYSPFWQIVR